MLRAANLLLALGRVTCVSSGTGAGDADMTTSLSIIFDFYVIYKLHAVDTEVDPPQRNSRHIRLRVVLPR